MFIKFIFDQLDLIVNSLRYSSLTVHLLLVFQCFFLFF